MLPLLFDSSQCGGLWGRKGNVRDSETEVMRGLNKCVFPVTCPKKTEVGSSENPSFFSVVVKECFFKRKIGGNGLFS